MKALEDQNMERTVESVVLVTKAQLSADDDGGSSSDENFDGQPWQKPFPEIEAKVSGKMVLVRIHCENRKGVLVKILSEIEHLNLTITNTNVMPFLGSSINITVTAQARPIFPVLISLISTINFNQFTSLDVTDRREIFHDSEGSCEEAKICFDLESMSEETKGVCGVLSCQ